MLSKRIELRVPSEVFSVLKFWSHQKNTTVSNLVRQAVELVYRKREKVCSPFVSVLGIINDKELSKDIDKQLYGRNP